jgi:PTS system mannose-specific IID component
MADKKKALTKGDRISVWWRNTFAQGSWNFERMQHLGFLYTMVPVIKRLYPDKEDRVAAMKRHMEFYNTQPYLTAPILGVVLALEEDKANGAPVDDATINGVKVGMMGPLAGVGDPVFWATLRPILGALAATFALNGNIMGPILFFVLWNAIRMGFLWVTQEFGYKQGVAITADLSGGILQKITQGASILGMFVMGILVPRWTSMNFSLPIASKFNTMFVNIEGAGGQVYELKDAAKALETFTNNPDAGAADLIQNGSYVPLDGGQLDLAGVIGTPYPFGVQSITTLQDIFNQLLPGLMPLALMFVVLFILRKKVNPIVVILALFVLGVLGYVAGVIS